MTGTVPDLRPYPLITSQTQFEIGADAEIRERAKGLLVGFDSIGGFTKVSLLCLAQSYRYDSLNQSSTHIRSLTRPNFQLVDKYGNALLQYLHLERT